MRFSLRLSLLCGLAALTALAAPQAAHASVLLTLLESGSNVAGTGSGTINTTALTLSNTGTGTAGVAGNLGFTRVGPNTSTSLDIYSGITGPTSFGSSGLISASSGSGNLIGVRGGNNTIFVSTGYVSSAALSGSATWASASFASLGLTPGTYTWNWGAGPTADSLTLQIGPSGGGAAPEPGTLALLALGGVCAFARRRRCIAR